MTDQVYYVVEDDHIEKAEVRVSTLTEDCLEVKFEGREYYSPINRDVFLSEASTNRKEAMRLLMDSLRQRQNYYQKQCAEIEKNISNIYRELVRT